MNYVKSKDLVNKTQMLGKLIKFFPKKERTYLYNDFYKLTNYTIELLLKKECEKNNEMVLKNEFCD